MASGDRTQQTDDHLFVGLLSILTGVLIVALLGAFAYYRRGGQTTHPATTGLEFMIVVFMILGVTTVGHGLDCLWKWHKTSDAGDQA